MEQPSDMSESTWPGCRVSLAWVSSPNGLRVVFKCPPNGLGVWFKWPFSEAVVLCYSGGPPGSHPFSSLSLCWGGVLILRGLPLSAAPFTFCGCLVVARQWGACLSNLCILLPDILVPGILRGILLVLSLLPRGKLVSR